MSKVFKKVLYVTIGILVVLSLLAEVTGDIITANTALAAVSGLPAIIATIADFWWIPMVLILVAVFLGSPRGKRFVRRYRRRR